MILWKWLSLPIAGAALSLVLARGGSDEDVTYHQDIQPILAKSCVPCHQAGGPSPFDLDTYASARRRAALIRWVCIVGSMPPVDAASDLGEMACVPRLLDRDLLAIQEWVRTGSKEGKPAPTRPPARRPWNLDGGADVTLRSESKAPLREEGAPYRTHYALEPGEVAGSAIAEFDITPDQPFAWRQAYVAVAPKDVRPESVFTATGIDTKYLVGAWAPGHYTWRSPRPISVGPDDRILVSALIQPSGKPERSGFTLGIRKGSPAAEMPRWMTLGNRDFAIAPADGGQTLRAETTLETPVQILAVVPECKLYAQQVRVFAVLPNGESKRILHILSWDMNWVGAYQPAKPISLPKGSKIVAEIDYDNSGHSGGNREARPTTSVRFGPTETDDLFWVHLQTIPHVQ